MNPRSWRPKPLAAALALTALGACGSPALEARSRPDLPISARPGTHGPAPARPSFVRPRTGLTDLRPAPIARVRPRSRGRALVVRFWTGAHPCYGLGAARADEDRQVVRVRILVGTDPAAVDVACPEVALLAATRVPLKRPLGDRTIRTLGP